MRPNHLDERIPLSCIILQVEKRNAYCHGKCGEGNLPRSRARKLAQARDVLVLCWLGSFKRGKHAIGPSTTVAQSAPSPSALVVRNHHSPDPSPSSSPLLIISKLKSLNDHGPYQGQLYSYFRYHLSDVVVDDSLDSKPPASPPEVGMGLDF